MKNLLDRIKEIRSNLSTALRESKGIDDLMDQAADGQGDAEQCREIGRRLTALAEAKEGDWVTHTFTLSTASELRSLAAAYDRLADAYDHGEHERRA